MLTDKEIRAAKPAAKAYRMADTGGLFLWVAPTGSRTWRWRYRVAGGEQTATIGRYPEVPLAEARKARDAMRDKLKEGGPKPTESAKRTRAEKRHRQAQIPTFAEAARIWHEANRPRWKGHHADQVLASLEREIFPVLGELQVNAITGAAVLAALRAVEGRGAVETARRLKQRCSNVFCWAIGEGWVANDPTNGLDAALRPIPTNGMRPAILDLGGAHELMRAIDQATGQPTTKVALRFLALTAARPGEVAGLQWAELHGLDSTEPEWRLPVGRTKITATRAPRAEEHVIPLTQAAVACLDAIRPLTGQRRHVFPNLFDPRKAISENAMGYMLIRLGYQGRHCPHGFRATFSSIMNERYPADRHLIDLMLAHTPKDRVESVYNRARHTARRRELAGLWADLLLAGACPASALVEGPRRQSAALVAA